MIERTVRSLAELSAFARAFLEGLPSRENATVIALTGNLGAGKTTFVQMLGEALNVEEQITSPTFVLMRTYKTGHSLWKKFVHIDAYRLETESEAGVLRLPELLTEPETLVAVEWPLRIASFIPEDAIHISFEINPDDSRHVTIHG